MTLKLKLGQRYVTRNGGATSVLTPYSGIGSFFPCKFEARVGEILVGYASDGRVSENELSGYDAVSLYSAEDDIDADVSHTGVNREKSPYWQNAGAADLTAALDADVGSAVEEALQPASLKDEPALRYDLDKSRVDLIPPDFIEALGLHYGIGAKKYAERNWEKGMSWSRCYASAQRHMLAYWRGEDIDAETGSPHLIAAAWNMAALHWYGKYNRGTDDRVKRSLDALSKV